ncbi:MAG TPA: amidohydrolase family protein, partial [Cytophagales bacterium]|nr:amidohydrolase family protein [Cytophagales bacterium]
MIFFPGKFLTAQSPYSQKYQFGKTTALVNATVYIDYKTRVDSATLICKDGKIVSVERKGIPPGEAEVLDYSGKVIYPSFVELISDYGVGNILSTPGGKPHYETTTKGAYSYNQAIKPEIEAERYFKHDPTKARILREQGFGTVISANGDGIVRGTSSAVLLTDLPEHESIIRSSASLNFSFNKGSSTQEYPSSLMGAIALVRQTLYDVDAYQKNKGKIPYDISMEKLSLYKTLPWIFETANAANILRAQKIANEFGAKVLMHASSDEYKHLQEIKKSNVFLIVSLNFPEAFKITSPKDAELISNTQLMEWYFAPFNIHYLSKENLDFAISASNLKDPKDFSKNLKKILETNVDAALVLKSLTYNPCVQLKIYDKVGSLHVGKLANFLVCNQTIDAKEFTIQENWVKGEKYIINQIHKNISGIYKLKIGSYPDMKLEVNTALEKPKATVSLLKDTSNIPAVIEQQNDQITVVFSPNKIDSSAKQKIYLRAYQYSEEYIKGNASSLAWTNDEVFSAHKIDSIKTLKKELSKIKLRVPSLALPYPFSAFVRDSIYRKQNCILKNAIIWTGEESFELEGYSLVLRDGIIAAIERDPDPRKYFGKQPYEVVDADSKYITAGIIDEHSHIAINGGVNETGKSVTSEVRIQDVINSQDINIYRQLAGGVTTAHLLHGSANCIGGQSVLINLKWGLSPEELKFHDNVPFIKFALGENVKQSNWGDRYVIRYPQSRMGVEQTIMDAFQRAQEYKKAQQQAQHSRSQTQIVTKKDLELEAILEILEKKRFITCHSYS